MNRHTKHLLLKALLCHMYFCSVKMWVCKKQQSTRSWYTYMQSFQKLSTAHAASFVIHLIISEVMCARRGRYCPKIKLWYFGIIFFGNYILTDMLGELLWKDSAMLCCATVVCLLGLQLIIAVELALLDFFSLPSVVVHLLFL